MARSPRRLARQRDRVIPFTKDRWRIYDEAAPQLMKLKSRTLNPPKFEQQTARDKPEHKNMRVQKLDQLIVEQHQCIDTLTIYLLEEVQALRAVDETGQSQ
jgi:hypothetical protein